MNEVNSGTINQESFVPIFILGQLLLLPASALIIFISQLSTLPFEMSGFDSSAPWSIMMIGYIFRSVVFTGFLMLINKIAKTDLRKIVMWFLGFIPFIISLFNLPLFRYPANQLALISIIIITVGTIYYILDKCAQRQAISKFFRVAMALIQIAIIVFFLINKVFLSEIWAGLIQL